MLHRCSILALFVALMGLLSARAEAPARQVAAGTAAVLKPATPAPLKLPRFVFEKITGPTAIFYFAPGCPHCQDAMPAVNALAKDNTVTWLGIASARATRSEVADFVTTYGVGFEVIQDDLNSAFSSAVGARSTPSVYIVEPSTAPVAEYTVTITDAYTPFGRGMAGLFTLRQNLSNPFGGFTTYQGPRVCGSCHQQEHRSWVITHHASAYRTLYTRERAEDPKCVGCHVTGMGEPGGFVSGDHGSPHRDVGCEACHGPGGPHNPVQATAVDPTASCVTCHDKDHSIAFSVQKGLPHIDHFKANSMSDDELRARIMAIGSGEAERPLLAFPHGPTVGAEACSSCHKAAHKSWSKSPHAKAMRRLKGSEREDVACVRCHATPTAYADQPATTFRADESVGCEACHGAGGDHIANPTKDNIVGLGESCPECVIEAVCTSCHTPKWDPEWDLKTRLEAAKH